MTPIKRCANPQCGHIEAVHYLGKCESLNAVPPCSCEAFVEPETVA